MAKEIVILSGSPRRGGNTDALVAAFRAGAESAGKAVTVFRVAHLKIAGCIGCEYCLAHPGKCALLLTCADESSDTAEGAVAMYRKTVEYYGWKDAGIHIATGVEHVGDIAGHAALVEAEAFGRAM